MTPPPPPTSPAAAALDQPWLSPAEFGWIRDFLRRESGIELKEGKQALVVGRLTRRLRHHGDETFSQYLQRLSQPGSPEVRIAVDLLTTNETYFWREESHFELLAELAREAKARGGSEKYRVWSAASSSGEEAYTIAMTLAAELGTGVDEPLHRDWEVLGTDISSRVVERARKGVYPIDAADKIPRRLLRAYCLKGRDEFDGYLAVSPVLRQRVTFREANLVERLPEIGTFDVIFLRNVMIYFGTSTKQSLVAECERLLRPGGYLLVSHSETLNGLGSSLRLVRPSVYRSDPA